MAESDGFEEVAGKLALVVLRKVPVANVLVDAVQSFLPNANEKLRKAMLDETVDAVLELESKVARIDAQLGEIGRQLDELGAVRTVLLAQDVASSATSARTKGKREAVLNAAARQFDPRKGDEAAREYWLQRVRALPETELALLLFLNEYDEIGFVDDLTVVVKHGPNDHIQPLPDVPGETGLAFRGAALRLAGEAPTPLIQTSHNRQAASRGGDQKSFPAFVLTPEGKTLVSFCKEI